MIFNYITCNDAWKKVSKIFQPVGTADEYIRVRPCIDDSTDTIEVKDVMLIDLTRMFGSGNEPTSYEEFERMFPESYYPYNTGEMLSVNSAGLGTRRVKWNQLVENDKINFINDETDDRTVGIIYIRSRASSGSWNVYDYTTLSLNDTNIYYKRIISIKDDIEYFDFEHNGQSHNITFYKKENNITFSGHIILIKAFIKSINVNIIGGVDIKNIQLFDLTEMFGSGNEPSTVEEFEALYPDHYYPYDPGSEKEPFGIECGGFNIWDEEWEIGSLNGSTGEEEPDITQFRSKNFSKCDGGVKYYMYGETTKYNIFFYDINKSFIPGSVIYGKNREITTPINACYFKIRTDSPDNIYNNDICINLSNPLYNGTYRPYKEKEILDLPGEYDELEYIESNGPQRIDTGWNETDKVAICCKLKNTNPSNNYLYGAAQHVVGASNMMYNGLYNNYILEYNWQSIRYTQSNDVEMYQKINGSNIEIKINDQTFIKPVGTSEKEKIYIFACNNSYVRYYTGMRLYWFQIYDDQDLVRDFIPVLRIKDYKPGLYDKVHKVFYPNSGTGEFKFRRKTTEFLPIDTTPFRYTYTGSDGLTYTAHGMKSAGNVYDEKSNQNIQRIGVVDLGSLKWSYYFDPATVSTYPYGFFMISLTNRKFGLFNVILSDKYCIGKGFDEDKTFFGNARRHEVYFVDSSYSDVASFKAAMSGVLLYYELLNPIVTPLLPNEPYEYLCEAGGEEKICGGELSCPVSGSIMYRSGDKIGVMWNQEIKTYSSSTAFGITVDLVQNGSVRIHGIPERSGTNNFIGGGNIDIVVGHKYFICGSKNSNLGVFVSNNSSSIYSYDGKSKIGIADQSANSWGYKVSITEGQNFDETIISQVFDLTLLFGAGHEPSTPEQFEEWLKTNNLSGYQPYDSGTYKELFVPQWYL